LYFWLKSLKHEKFQVKLKIRRLALTPVSLSNLLSCARKALILYPNSDVVLLQF
jgi:hypothetical protein